MLKIWDGFIMKMRVMTAKKRLALLNSEWREAHQYDVSPDVPFGGSRRRGAAER